MKNSFVFCNSVAKIFARNGIVRNSSKLTKYPSRYEGYFNEVTLNRNPAGSILGALFDTKYTNAPNIIYLAGGFPNPTLFPFEKASFRLKNNKVINMDEEVMLKGLQYGCIQGYGPLVTKLKSYMTRFHNVTDWQNRDLTVCAGGTDALSRCLEMVLQDDVFMLAEEPLFGSISSYIEAYSSQYIGIERDEFGMKPRSLRKTVLDLLNQKPKPKKMIIYVNYITMKRSPATELEERLRKIYEIAQEFDILIVEIDPHFLLHVYRKNDKYFPSLLKLDTDERVLRIDSASALFGPGLRIGYVTGPRELIRLICSHIDGSMLHASQLSQVLISKTTEESEEVLEECSNNIYENLLSEKRNLEIAAKAYLGKLKWNIYPEFPFISFKVENTPELVKYLEDEESEIKFALSPYCLSSKEPNITLGVSLAGASKEQMEKICCKIADILTKPLKNSTEIETKYNETISKVTDNLSVASS